ncbi:hypothetical protein RUM44_003927 [Polyplax serrata]|uniref:Soluble interferon alpha/beta receptor OPG204 n=1 Tax=Polyplax serrata TaxID=468196 RepID=A0ABR1B1D3_POLSC
MVPESIAFLCIISPAFESALAMIDYCRNNTFDPPTNREKLHFSKENSDEEFGIYDKFKCLHCCSHGYRSIEWFKDGHPYPWPTHVSTLIIYSESGNQTIYSQQLTTVDSGTYWCIVKNDTHFLRHEVLLKVSEASISMGWPKTTYRPRDQKAAQGESVRFYCEAFVGTIDLPDFQSEIVWKKHNSTGSFINGVRIIQEPIFREEKRVIGSYLSFTSVKEEDYGRYICMVKNLGDQVLELSAWLKEKKDGENDAENNSKEIPIYPSQKVHFVTRECYVIVLLLVLTAVTSTVTLLHFGSYLKSVRKRIFQGSCSQDDGKTDLLIIHHECDAGDVGGILTALKGRHNYSSSVYPLQSRSEIGNEDLKAKATSYRGLLVIMTPALLGGPWSGSRVHSTINSLVKIHFTVICMFEQGLPVVAESERKLLHSALKRVHYVEGTIGKNLKFWNWMRLKLSSQNNGDESPRRLDEII